MEHSQTARITSDTVIFLECDIQDGGGNAAKMFYKYDVMAHNAKRLTQVAKLLNIPIVATRQNPKLFGDSDKSIERVSNRTAFDKTKFSMLEPQVLEHIRSFPDRKQIVLYGMEAHVCMRQTCFDLLPIGYSVHLLADACTSMNNVDRNVGI